MHDSEPVVYPDLPALLLALGVSDVDDLIEELIDITDCSVWTIEDENDDHHLLTIVGGWGVVNEFPATWEEIVESVEDVRDLEFLEDSLEELVTSIEAVEGLSVEIELDGGFIDADVCAKIGRRMSPSGILVQNYWTFSYPFEEPMADSASVAEWLEKRFHAHLPGMLITVHAPLDATLGEVRRENDDGARAARPRVPRA